MVNELHKLLSQIWLQRSPPSSFTSGTIFSAPTCSTENTYSPRCSQPSPSFPAMPNFCLLPIYLKQYLFFCALCHQRVLETANLQKEGLVFLFALLAFQLHLLQLLSALVKLIFELPVGLSLGKQRFLEYYDLAFHLYHLLSLAYRIFCLCFERLHTPSSFQYGLLYATDHKETTQYLMG